MKDFSSDIRKNGDAWATCAWQQEKGKAMRELQSLFSRMV